MVRSHGGHAYEYFSDKMSQLTTHDRGKKATIDHLKNLAGETQNINESKINLDS